MDYLLENQLDVYISTRKLSRKLKKINKRDKPCVKDKFIFNLEKNTYICPMGQILENQRTLKKTSQESYIRQITAKITQNKKNAVEKVVL